MPAVSQHSEDDSLFSHDFLKYRGLSNRYHLTRVSDEETEAINATTLQLHPSDVFLRDVKASVTFHLSEVTAIVSYLQPHHPAESLYFYSTSVIEGECIIYNQQANSHSFCLPKFLYHYRAHLFIVIAILVS